MTIQEYLTQWLTLSGLTEDEFSIEIEEADKQMLVKIALIEEKAGYYIGSRGETLDAIQQVVNISFRDEAEKIIIDINNYKQQREQALMEKAERIALELLETGNRFVFNNLNSYERFLVHSFIANDSRFNEKLETFSQDSFSGRVLVLQNKNG